MVLSGYGRVLMYNHADVTIGAGVLVHGQGQFGSAHYGDERFTNAGTIRADVDGGTLQLSGNGWENEGTVEAVNNATLITNTSTYTWSSSGLMKVQAGSLISGYSFTQSATATLSVGVSGLGVGEFGTLSVTGLAALAGTVHVDLAPDYIPLPGDVYAFMGFGSRSGAFELVSCDVPCVNFGIRYDSIGAELIVTATGLGDLDQDCDVDFDDGLIMFGCLSGPDVTVAPACLAADLDADNDADLRDFELFQRLFEGH